MIDGHVHLNEIKDHKGAIERARAAGVEQILAVGMDLESNRRTLELADGFSDVVLPAVGYHPWNINADEITVTLSHLDENLGRCVALGEVGLDYKVKVNKNLQREVFAEVLKLAEHHRKPVIVHSRYSHQRCHQMVSEQGLPRAVFHWYSGSTQILERIIGDGYFVSCTPALAYSPAHRRAIQIAPLDTILVETDSPVAYRGKVSEPAHLSDTIGQLSRLKNLPEDEVAQVTTATARRFFRI